MYEGENMSYISTMGVSVLSEGIVMLTDMQLTHRTQMSENHLFTIANKSYRKLFTIGDNIGVSFCGALGRITNIPYNVLIDEFCRRNIFRSPQEAANAIHEYIVCHCNNKDLVKIDGECEYVVHIAGYIKHEKGLVCPSMYRISTLRCETKSGYRIIEYKGDKGFMQCGNMLRITQYVNLINSNQDLLDHLTLQEAVDTSKTMFDVARGLERCIDRMDTISENFEMIALTPDGIKWLKKAELEVKDDNYNAPEVV